MGCYTLNFYGRVKRASAKNFQIIEEGVPHLDAFHGRNGFVSAEFLFFQR
jgi:hypothetical protein